MATTKQKNWTYQEYFKLNDDNRYEVIEGELLEVTASPNFKHQKISINLSYILLQYVRSHGLGEVLTAPIDVSFNKNNVLQPDLVYISKEKKHLIQENGIFGTPDLVIEILSPSTANYDKNKKFKVYEKFGVEEFWLVDPIEKKLEVFVKETEGLLLYSFVKDNKKLKSKLFPDILISYQELVQ